MRARTLRIGAVSALVGLVCAAVNVGFVGGSGSFDVATVAVHLLVDLPGRSLVARPSPPASVPTLIKRAELLGGVMASPPVVELIGRRAHVPAGLIAASTRTTASVPIALLEPGSERRANDIRYARRPYRLEVQVRQTSPVIDVYVQAPTAAAAERLANAAGGGLLDFLGRQQALEGVAGEPPVRLQQLGETHARMIGGVTTVSVALLTFMLAFGLACAAQLGLSALRRSASQRGAAGGDGDGGDDGLPAAEPVPRPAPGDDWPRTSRLMPWTLAVFIAVLWLVPFNVIALKVSLPIDLKFDRLVLPVVIAAWLLAIAAGGRMAPKLRLSWTHAALAAFIACAFLSVVVSAHDLNVTGELDLSIKKLPLLLSYVSLFVIAASAVRRTEVPAFLTYTIVLAVICGIGLIWEYRFKTNVFYLVSAKLLPHIFTVPDANATAVDAIGRRVVRGPGEVGLEAVTMLCLALSIALVGFLERTRRGHRVLYALAVCILLAAMMATFRKSALLAPVSVVLTLAYFRRRQLVKLAPVGLVLIVMVQILSPGALRQTTDQFFRQDRSKVATVSDRTSDYDAIRPDVWTHPAFGRGFGSYDHETYRILDSEILLLLIETGVAGLAFFLLIPVAVIATSRATIAGRDPARAGIALVGASAGVCFIVVSTLYDVLSFPHATYIFLYIAGLVTVTCRPQEHGEEEIRVPRGGARAAPAVAGYAAARIPARSPLPSAAAHHANSAATPAAAPRL
jgi:hypothetical protein